MIYDSGFRVYRPTERERTERLIKTRLREIMMQRDLENVTSKEVRTSSVCILCASQEDSFSTTQQNLEVLNNGGQS